MFLRLSARPFPQASRPALAAGLIALALAGSAPSPAAFACSILTLRTADAVLMGNNEDWREPGYLWFEPAAPSRYGRVNVGFGNKFTQGSMNEKGLSFDAAVVPDEPWSEDPAKETPGDLLEKIMNECATVEEALAYFRKYNTPHLSRTQFLFADASGDSAVVAWKAGRLSVQRIEGDHQIATNTRLEGTGYRCQRYAKAEQMLRGRGAASAHQAVAETLHALRQQGEFFTSYSTVYDLTARRVSVFNLANFDEVKTFDLREELAKGAATHRLGEIFKRSPSLSSIRSKRPRRDFATWVRLSDEQLDRLTGVYSPVVAPGVQARVLREGAGLRVVNPGQSDAELFPESESVFRMVPDRGQVSFRISPEGEVLGLTLHKEIDVYAPRVGDLD
ncbi:MAG: carcinine hydrolase/isopenicillin-N N-acyltransferase family protein [Acidobacteriota bacterium]